MDVWYINPRFHVENRQLYLIISDHRRSVNGTVIVAKICLMNFVKSEYPKRNEKNDIFILYLEIISLFFQLFVLL